MQGGLLPAWMAMGMAVPTLLVLALHFRHVSRRHQRAPSRRRIRQSYLIVAMGLVPMLAIAFAVDPDVEPRRWTFAWVTSIILLSMVLLLAMVDVLNTARLFLQRRRALRRRLETIMQRGEEQP